MLLSKEVDSQKAKKHNYKTVWKIKNIKKINLNRITFCKVITISKGIIDLFNAAPGSIKNNRVYI